MRKIIFLLLAALLIFFIPLLIDMLFRGHFAEITVFKESEILSYYGSILGALITLVVAVLTIQFTRKQVRRQAYVDREKEKWTKIESIIAEIITRINPLNLLLITVSSELKDITSTTTAINKYGLDCKIATDILISHLNYDEDYPKVKELIDSIMKAGEMFNNASQELCQEYLQIGSLRTRDIALEFLQSEYDNPGVLDKKKVVEYQNIVQQTEGMNYELILSNIGDTKMKLTKLYESEFRNLLGIKGVTFKRIRDEIDSCSFNILDEWF